jgi:transcriptional regulator GlxA family with amidase domain
MSSKLNHIQDWVTVAKQTNWSVTNLAKFCGVSARTLERYFKNWVGKTPKEWLAHQRYLEIQERRRKGLSMKQTAHAVGYKHSSTFSREFKKLSTKYSTCFWPHLSTPQDQSETTKDVAKS